jgi:hypothetical protein
MPVGSVSRIRHYRNLHLTAARLERLLREFAFGPLADLLRSAAPLAVAPSPASEPTAVVTHG